MFLLLLLLFFYLKEPNINPISVSHDIHLKGLFGFNQTWINRIVEFLAMPLESGTIEPLYERRKEDLLILVLGHLSEEDVAFQSSLMQLRS